MKPTIGIEVHVELKSMAKVFSNSKNNFNDDANTNVNIIDLGYPGSLPKLNKKIIDLALKAALSLNCKINKTMHFDRKNYFYPDLPKGYQITQKDTPIGYDGYLEIDGKKIEIERIHIEEDTCKSLHRNDTLLNYNRAGVPLIEIVTKPCITSGDEAMKYVEKLRQTLLYLDVSDVKIEEGSMRCDVNVSVSDTDVLGTKCEIKNIGSISNVGISIDYEINRQIELLKNNTKIVEETRRYDDKTKSTVLMRVKETGNEYRYFPEPDIPYVTIDDEWINRIKSELPVMADELKKKYKELNINDNCINTIVNNKDICNFFESVIDKIDPIIGANLLTGDIMAILNKDYLKINDTNLNENNFVELINLLENKKISTKQAKEIIPILIKENKTIENIIKENDFIEINDTTELTKIIKNIIDNNPDSVNDYKEKKDRAIKYLMGQIMKETKGKANPVIVNNMLIELLNSLINK